MDGPAPHQRSSTIISTRSRDPSTSALPSARTSMRVDSTPASTRRDRTARARDNERRRLRLCSASVPGAYAFRRRRRKGSSLSPCRQGLQRLRDIIQRFGGVGREGNGQPLSLGRGRLDALPDRWRRISGRCRCRRIGCLARLVPLGLRLRCVCRPGCGSRGGRRRGWRQIGQGRRLRHRLLTGLRLAGRFGRRGVIGRRCLGSLIRLPGSLNRLCRLGFGTYGRLG